MAFFKKYRYPAALAALLPLLMFFPLAVEPGVARGADNSPLAAVTTAQRGIDGSDADVFRSAVDIDRILSSAASALGPEIQRRIASGQIKSGGDGLNTPALLLLSGATGDSGQSEMLRQMLFSEVKSFVNAGINGGYFAGTPDARIKPQGGLLSGALERMPKGRRELAPGKVLREEGAKARCSAVLVDPKAGNVPLELGLERQDGRWRVVEVVNAASLLDRFAAGKSKKKGGRP